MTLIPCEEVANELHELIPLEAKGVRSKGAVEACINRAFIQVYGINPFTDVFTQAAALLYSFISFHPYNDGNKRTALLITWVFLSLHGYTFYFPRDVVEFVKSLADLSVEGTEDDMRRIATWIRGNPDHAIEEGGCVENEIFGIDEDAIYAHFNNTRVSFMGLKEISVKIRKETI